MIERTALRKHFSCVPTETKRDTETDTISSLQKRKGIYKRVMTISISVCIVEEKKVSLF